MPKKPYFSKNKNYVVCWIGDHGWDFAEFTDLKIALNAYGVMKQVHGKSCRLMRVLLDYGEEI